MRPAVPSIKPKRKLGRVLPPHFPPLAILCLLFVLFAPFLVFLHLPLNLLLFPILLLSVLSAASFAPSTLLIFLNLFPNLIALVIVSINLSFVLASAIRIPLPQFVLLFLCLNFLKLFLLSRPLLFLICLISRFLFLNIFPPLFFLTFFSSLILVGHLLPTPPFGKSQQSSPFSNQVNLLLLPRPIAPSLSLLVYRVS